MRRAAVVVLLLAGSAWAEPPRFGAELVFPLERWHNHSSSLVELPGGDLLVCWYHGSGERKADDVKVEVARLRRGETAWGQRSTLVDTPGFPDTNPVLFVDSKKRLWLIWSIVVANEWHTALLEHRIASLPLGPGDRPRWDVAEPLLFVPRNFATKVKEAITPWLASVTDAQQGEWVKTMLGRAEDKYFSRMGWMARTHPLELASGRILVPLYSDGYDFSLVAITDDGGATWTTSEPLVSAGGVQPSLVRRRDGTLVAYMRDNGPPPNLVLTSTSQDNGITWSPVKDTELPNPGSSLEVVALRNGVWAMVHNDLEQGRHSLAVALSDDEGSTWRWKRHIELDRRGQGPGSFHYPSVLQTQDGTIHVTYSYFLNFLPEGAPRKAIKHAAFNVDWVKQGDPRE
jgi:predicted neuraminidase